MKRLYEATNGYLGESYVRCYAWADSPDEAAQLAEEAFRADAQGQPSPTYYTRIRLTQLFAADAPSFVTVPSDEGWERTP